MTKKWAIYSRTSRIDQKPENQVIELERYAKAHGYEHDVYWEKESTRKTRPIKAELMRKIRKGEYRGVIVWKITRWARSFIELIQEIEEFKNKGIGFISLDLGVDTSTTTGMLTFRILSAVAEFEREVTRENTNLGLQRARLQGKTLGRPKGAKDKKKRRKSGYYRRWDKNGGK